MVMVRIDDAQVRDAVTGELIQGLVGQQVKIVTRDTTTPFPIYDAIGDPIPGSVVTVTPVFTVPRIWVDVTTPADVYLDWYDEASGVRGPVDFDRALRDSAAAAAASASASASAATTAQAAAETAASAAAAALPVGGTTGQSLVKLSNTDRHVGWATVSGGGGGGAVTSVAGKTGDVSLVKGDVGLGQVDNTSDANKPVSTAQAAAIAAKANASHTHAISDVTALQSALDSKAGLNAAVNASQINAGTGVIAPARLGSGTPSGSNFLRGDGTWATPPGGGSGGAVDSVNGQTGEVILDAADVGALPDTYTAPVVSVAGKTGVVTLAKGDVGLGAVDNTSDANKPVSTAQQAALDTKAADSAVVKLTGNQSIGGVKTFTSAPVVPDASFPQAKVSGLTTALAGKVSGLNGLTGIWRGSQSAYDALGTYDDDVLYIVTGA